MASSQSRGGERMIHQDFIARIRFSNALPPPPVPPKLLDIPNTGLASGQYTTPGFASRLAREQPLNIEADAELGMPLDLVGMPGIFDGDESAIQAPAHAPTVHPRDRALLRPLSTLGKPKVTDATVSFLRRTEYISSLSTKARPVDIFLKPHSSSYKRAEKRKASPEPDHGSPAYIKRKIEKSFAAAALNVKDRSRVKHPSKRNVRLVDAYPMLPDLDAFPDSGTYVTVKFTHNPVPSTTHYDTRLLSGIFKPIERNEAEDEAFEAALKAHARDPERNPRPPNMMNYEFFLPSDQSAGDNFRRRFDVDDPKHDSPELYPRGLDCFQFKRVRAYETAQETELDHVSKYDDELILAVNEDESRGQRAVYYYPVMQRSTVRSQRTKNIARTAGIAQDDEQVVHQLDVTVDEPGEDLKQAMLDFKKHPFGYPEEEEEEEEREESVARERNGHGQGVSHDVEDDERDAEGEEED